MEDRWADGEAYERYVGRWSRRVGDIFVSWLQAPAGASWLDLGCGTGALTDQVLSACQPKKVIGVEPSHAFLALAREQVTDLGAEFRQGEAERIPVADGEVEFAVAGLVLNFVSDAAQAMSELVRCVRPGGSVAAYVWDYAGRAQFIRAFWDAVVALDRSARVQDEGVRFPLCRPGPLRSLFEHAGLRNVATTAIDIPTHFSDFDDYWQPFLTGVGPAPGYCASLDEASRQQLRDRLRRSLPTGPDGQILLSARAWAVRGTR